MTLTTEKAYPDSRVMRKEEARMLKRLKTQRMWIGVLGILLVVLGVILANVGLFVDNTYATTFGGFVAVMGAAYCIFWAVDDND